MFRNGSRLLFVFGLAAVLLLPALSDGAPRPLRKKQCVRWVSLPDAFPFDIPVDWQAVRRAVSSLGYPSHVIDSKIAELNSDPESVLAPLRARLPRKKWKPSDGVRKSHLPALVREQDEKLLRYLGLWIPFADFSASEFVEAFLNRSKDPLGEDSVKYLQYWSHLWLRGPNRRACAARLWERSKDLRVGGWLINELRGRDRAFIGEQVRAALRKMMSDVYEDPDEFLLLALHYVLPAFLPAETSSVIADRVDAKAYPPVVTDAIKLSARGYGDAGTCRYMSGGHLSTLGLFGANGYQDYGAARQTVLVRVNGVLIGALKRTGDPSMIALRNVINPDGRPLLVMGGVYRLPKDVLSAIETIERPMPRRGWLGADVPSLRVTPLTFLLNQYAWETHRDRLLELAARDIPKSLLEKSRLAGNALPPPSEQRLRQQVWRAFLRSLNEVRRALER